MEILSISDKAGIIDKVAAGMVFIYPTDTVYGIGCNALNAEAVSRVRSLKGTDHPFSVIAPSRSWILDNLETAFPAYLDKLPGPYTLILRKKARPFLEECSATGKLGVRIPDHPFTWIVQEAGLPFVTTSANVSGRPNITSLGEIPEALKAVDFAVDSSPLEGEASEVYDLTGDQPKRLR